MKTCFHKFIAIKNDTNKTLANVLSGLEKFCLFSVQIYIKTLINDVQIFHKFVSITIYMRIETGKA